VRYWRAAHPFRPCQVTWHHESEQDEISTMVPPGNVASVADLASGDACSFTRPIVLDVAAPAVMARTRSANEARTRGNLI
jgi:hypothetical protein